MLTGPALRSRPLLAALVFATCAACAPAQVTPPPATVPTSAPATAPAASTATTVPSAPQAAVPSAAVPFVEVAPRSEVVAAHLRDVAADVSYEQAVARIDDELPVVAREIDARLDETRRIVSPSPSLQRLRGLAASWRGVSATLTRWQDELGEHAAQLDREAERLGRLETTWRLTLDAARAKKAPPEVVQRAQDVLGSLLDGLGQVVKQRERVLAAQTRVSEQEARVAEAMDAIDRAYNEAVDQLFVRGAAPVWSREARSSARRDAGAGQDTFTAQVTALRSYAERQAGRFVLHLLIFAALAQALTWARRRIGQWAREDPDLVAGARVFDTPVATSLALAALLSLWIYPQPPRLLWAMIGAAALIPAVVMLRRFVGRQYQPVLYALVAFYFVDRLRMVTASLPMTTRLLFLAEMLGGLLFLAWFIPHVRRTANADAIPPRLRAALRVYARVALAAFAAAFVTNAFGYVSLAELLGHGLLASAYVAIILYAAARILEGLFVVLLHLPPLNQLGAVAKNRPLLRRRARLGLRWGAWALWWLFALEALAIRRGALETVEAILTAELAVGGLRLSLGGLLAFSFAVWAAFLVSRFVRFILEEDVYARFHLGQGLPYAISRVLHYAILLIGFFAAIAASGYDLTRFTILAGAFGVGLGLGLQNIVNNFVSGLILLFERPVKVGDVVQIGDMSGTVMRIGVRASAIRTAHGSAIIIPNARLISDPVTNWTLLGRQRSIEVPVAVPQGTDIDRVVALLAETAAANPALKEDPPPQALFVKFGPGLVHFELRAWTSRVEHVTEIRSDLGLAVRAALARENIPAS